MSLSTVETICTEPPMPRTLTINNSMITVSPSSVGPNAQCATPGIKARQ